MDLYSILRGSIMEEIYNQNLTDTSEYDNIPLTTTENKIFLVILGEDDYSNIPIQFVPDRIPYERRVNTQLIQPIARNIPEYCYSGGETIMTLSLDFHAQQEDRKDVIETVRRLEALGYTDGYGKEKPKVRLVWDKLFTTDIWEVGNIKIDLTNFKPEHGFLPQQAYVELQLMLFSNDNPTWEVITGDR